MSLERTRMRSYNQGSATKQSKVLTYPWGSEVRYPYVARQKTVSEGHPFRGSLSGGDQGGPFESWHSHYDKNESIYLTPTSSSGISYRIRIFADSPISPTFASSPLSDEQLLARGTTAIAECRPTAPLAGLGVTLGELREGLPRIIGSGLLKTRLHSLKKVPSRGSDEFLNWEFGWKPLVKDLRDSARAVIRSEQILSQLVRDSGRPVRRKFGFPLEVSTTSAVSTSYGYPIMVTQAYAGSGKLLTTVKTTNHVWFSGCFRYYLPTSDGLLDKAHRWSIEANRLLGLRPDPELIWELAPWSWLADWFGNTGDVLANASSIQFDNLVIDYGYVMNHFREETHKALYGLTVYPATLVNLTQSFVREHKRRLRATPFGFGIEWPDFTSRQLAILAALGISRAQH